MIQDKMGSANTGVAGKWQFRLSSENISPAGGRHVGDGAIRRAVVWHVQKDCL